MLWSVVPNFVVLCMWVFAVVKCCVWAKLYCVVLWGLYVCVVVCPSPRIAPLTPLAHLGNLGFMLSSALLVVGSMNAFIRWLTDVEIQMNSVERVIYYTQLPTEAPAEIPETRPPPEWPAKGGIEIEVRLQ